MYSISPSVATVVALLFGCCYFFRKKYNDEIKLPPYAPGSMLKHTQMISGNQFPWFVLNVSRELLTSVFQVSVPLRLFTRVFMVGEGPLVSGIVVLKSFEYINCLSNVHLLTVSFNPNGSTDKEATG